MLEIPTHIVAATRLGVAKEAGQTLVVVLDKKSKRRSLWLANDLGMKECNARYVYRGEAPDPLKLTGNALLMVLAKRQTREVETINLEHVYEVVEHLGNEDEAIRCVPLIEAERLGVPILDWPAHYVRYRVQWAPGLWAKHEAG